MYMLVLGGKEEPVQRDVCVIQKSGGLQHSTDNAEPLACEGCHLVTDDADDDDDDDDDDGDDGDDRNTQRKCVSEDLAGVPPASVLAVPDQLS